MAGHVACIGTWESNIKCCSENVTGRDHLGDLVIDGKVILTHLNTLSNSNTYISIIMT